MIIDLDIGNTLTKWRLKNSISNEVVDRGAIWTRARWENSQEIPDFKQLKVIRVSNVGGKDIIGVVERLAKRYRVPVHVARSTTKFAGVRNGYLEPEKLGIDRWLGVLSGYHAVGGCIVIDCGSAITLDLVQPDGAHLGGYIAPGLRLMRESLKLGTNNLLIDINAATADLITPGRVTKDAVSHGIYLSALGNLELVLKQAKILLPNKELPLIFTGGDAELLAKGISAKKYLWPDMVYAGLELMFPVSNEEKLGELTGMPQIKKS